MKLRANQVITVVLKNTNNENTKLSEETAAVVMN